MIRRLYHGRPYCNLEPHSIRVENLMAQFQEGVLSYTALDSAWRSAVLKAVRQDQEDDNTSHQRVQLERALQGRIDSIQKYAKPIRMPDLSKAAELLSDLPALWVHPGTTDNQREELVKELLTRVEVKGAALVAVEPKGIYRPLFAYALTRGVRNGRGERTRTSDPLHPMLYPEETKLGAGFSYKLAPAATRLFRYAGIRFLTSSSACLTHYTPLDWQASIPRLVQTVSLFRCHCGTPIKTEIAGPYSGRGVAYRL